MVANGSPHSTEARETNGGTCSPAIEPTAWPVAELQRLREENAMLRQSAQTFGALAERLHEALQRERQPFGRSQSDAFAHAG